MRSNLRAVRIGRLFLATLRLALRLVARCACSASQRVHAHAEIGHLAPPQEGAAQSSARAPDPQARR